jgi:hypothetical protein
MTQKIKRSMIVTNAIKTFSFQRNQYWNTQNWISKYFLVTKQTIIQTKVFKILSILETFITFCKNALNAIENPFTTLQNLSKLHLKH